MDSFLDKEMDIMRGEWILEEEEYSEIYKNHTVAELIIAGYLIDRLKFYKESAIFVDQVVLSFEWPL